MVLFTGLSFLLAICLVSAIPTAKRANNVFLTSEFDSFIQGILTEWGSPGGLSIAAVARGEDGTWTVESKGYGNATSGGIPVDDDTMFSIGSNSKLFTSFATGLLLANETITPRFTLATKMKDILPDWELADDIASSQSTIIDLLSHRTGLAPHDASFGFNNTAHQVLSRVKYLKPSTTFRDRYEYNNIMYTIASLLPTTLLPDPITFTSYVKQHILDPLGLTSTTYSHVVAAQAHVLAQGFSRHGMNVSEDPFATGEPVALEFWAGNATENNAIAGPGGLIMNAKDILTWLQALLLDGANPVTGDQVVPSEVAALLATGVTVVPGTDSPAVYGAGQWRTTYRGQNVIEHDGHVPGFYSAIARVPDIGVGLAVLCNDETYGSALIDIVKKRMLDMILRLEPIDWSAAMKQTVLEMHKTTAESVVPRPSDPVPPSAELTVLEGTYTDAGYGYIELCYIASSDSCSDILAHLPNATEGANGIPTLIAKWDKTWTSHLRLQHFNGDSWNVSLLNSQAFVTPNGLPTGKYWTSSISPWSMAGQFVVEDGKVAGFGIGGGIWGASPNGEAEVFFNRS